MGTEGGGYDFLVVSEKSGEALNEARPGTTVISEEQVYPASSAEGFDHSDGSIGTVTIVQWKSSERRAAFIAHFAFEDGDSVSLTGFAPNGNWLGRGVVAYSGGTGKFTGRAGQLDLASENPKRWG